MDSLKWCLKHKDGIRIISPNKNISDSYIHMAEDSIKVLNKIGESKIWTATTTYYIFYYSLYSLMIRIGIKCEIHSCSLAFMKQCLNDFYNEKDVEMIEKSFSARRDLQYYADRPVDDSVIQETKTYCKDFYIKTKDILAKINENQIKTVRAQIS